MLPRTLLRALTVLVGSAVVALLPGTASAAEDGDATAGGLGYDVSYPQCRVDLPTDGDFGIVGVNGGVATRVNPCLDEQLSWAAASSGDVPEHPALQVYVNTANPGQVQDLVTTWPRSGDSPYGRCSGDSGPACSWVYGRTRASVDIHGFLLPAARAAGLSLDPADLRWWLDVETANTWQTGSATALANNRATLEGMADYLTGTGAEVGLYSVGRMWRQIVGWVPPGSPLHELDSWLAGASSREQAQRRCADLPLTGGGAVVLAQYVVEVDGRLLDHNLPC